MVDFVASFYSAIIPRHATGRLLDLGCGKAPLFGAYREHVSDVTLVDWPNSFHDCPHLDAEVDLTKPLPFAERSFDTVILSDVLEHIPNPADLCEEIARVLVPDGKLLMNVPFYYWLHEQPYDYYRFTEFALRHLMDRAGLRVLELVAMGGSVAVLADISCKNLASVPVMGSPMCVVGQALAGTFCRSSPGRALAAATSSRFPLLYGVVAQR